MWWHSVFSITFICLSFQFILFFRRGSKCRKFCLFINYNYYSLLKTIKIHVEKFWKPAKYSSCKNWYPRATYSTYIETLHNMYYLYSLISQKWQKRGHQSYSSYIRSHKCSRIISKKWNSGNKFRWCLFLKFKYEFYHFFCF